MTLLLLLMLLGCPTPQPEPVVYTVARGDTLFVIAREHNVTVAQLQAWNHLEGDLIEVGQALEIRPWEATTAPPVATTQRSKRASTPTRPAPSTPGLSMPAPEPCRAGPSLDALGDEGTMASTGVSKAEAKAAVSPLLPLTLGCVPGTSGELVVDLHIACSGVVSRVDVVQRGPWEGTVHDCITDVLRHADFPAHALPDGDVVRWPLTYTF